MATATSIGLEPVRASEKGEAEQIRGELAEARIHILALQERLRQSEQRCRQMEASWSWRLTAPFRAAAKLASFGRQSLCRWRRAWEVLWAEGPRVMAIKAGLELVGGFCRALGRPLPFRTRYFPPEVPGGRQPGSVGSAEDGGHTAGPLSSSSGVLLVLASPKPEVNPVVRGQQVIYGCAAAAAGIETVEIEVDGRLLGTAEHGLPSRGLDLAAELPQPPKHIDLSHAVFRFTWDTSRLSQGRHRLVVRARSRDGQQRWAACSVWTLRGNDQQAAYQRWIAQVEAPDVTKARCEAATLRPRPLISVLMPVFDAPAPLLSAAIESVRSQFYDRWELCVADDGSVHAETQAVLAQCAGDPRIKVRRLPENRGIAAATQAALAMAEGHWVALLDQDDLLAPHALFEVACAAADPQAILIYSDEDKIDAAGTRYEPFFKPDWSPELFLSCNYLNHLTAIRADVLRAVGGFCPTYDFSQDYDVFLRVTEQPGRIVHLPKVLYHWRATAGSSAAVRGAKAQAQEAARRALQTALQRRRLHATVEPGPQAGTWRVRFALQSRPLVSVLLPCGGNLTLLRQCIDGLAEKTSYRPLEIVLVDNSRSAEVHEFYRSAISRRFPCTRYLDCRGLPFNYSKLNNWAAQAASGSMLLLLNDDIVPINSDWLEAMLEHAQRPEIGAVGAKLLYPNGLIQHAGVVMGIFGSSGHAFKMLPGDEVSGWRYFGLPHLVRNTSAVTAACLLLRREVFEEVGGFDEEHLPVAFQDVDLCLRILDRGYRNVYTPYARLYHYESVTKTEKTPNRAEVEYLMGRWSRWIACDPYYSPHLTRRSEDYAIGIA